MLLDTDPAEHVPGVTTHRPSCWSLSSSRQPGGRVAEADEVCFRLILIGPLAQAVEGEALGALEEGNSA